MLAQSVGFDRRTGVDPFRESVVLVIFEYYQDLGICDIFDILPKLMIYSIFMI